jgi:hypothetical protein
MTGVSLSECPDVQSADMLTKTYYSLGLFVMSGLDLGTPIDGPLFARLMIWLSYFGSPMLAASTIIEAVIKTISHYKWHFQRISNHIVVSGSDELTITYLKQLRLVQPKVPLLGKDNFQNYEAAHKILQLQPSLKGKIVIHCNSIRFMRFMTGSEVAKQCINFNAYQLAASALVQQHLL